MASTPSLDCVIPAAGSSTRMGRPKLLLPYGDGTVLGATIGNALAAGLRVIVVVGPNAEPVRSLCRGLEDVLIAENPDPGRGMLSSLQAGVRRVEAERFFMIPADMPFVMPGVYRRLAEIEAEGPIFPTFEGAKGHPVLVPSRIVPAILELGPDQPLRALLSSLSPTLVEIGDDSILRDLDTPEDYAKVARDIDTPEDYLQVARARGR